MLLYPPKSPSSTSSKGIPTPISPKFAAINEESSIVTGVTAKSSSSKERKTSPDKPRIETQQRPPDSHPIDGRVPTEASFNVMKMVIGAAGVETKMSGKSTSNQLRSLRTEPSLKLLKTTSWREFFDAEAVADGVTGRTGSPSTNGQSDKKDMVKTDRSDSPSRLAVTLTASQSFPVLRPYSTANLSNSMTSSGPSNEPTNIVQIFHTLVQRIEELWAELKVPAMDVKFYKETLCSGKIRGFDHCRELARYIKTLLQHRRDTLRVVQAIELRELLVSHFHDVLLSLNRKFVYRKSYESFSGDKATKGISFDSNLAWKEEMVEVLKELQTQTVDVVQAIQQWRKGLWRPHAFVYKGQDYIAKMATDLSVLGTELYMSELETIPICRSELICLLFTDYDGDFEVRTNQPEWKFKTEMASNMTAAANQQLREYFLGGEYVQEELQLASKVIQEDSKLQRAIKTERETLLAKRVFIPTLRVDLIKPAEPARANPFYNKYHEHIKRPASASQQDVTNNSFQQSKATRPTSAKAK